MKKEVVERAALNVVVMVGLLFTLTSIVYEVKFAPSYLKSSSPVPTTVEERSKSVTKTASVQLRRLHVMVQLERIRT